jgi:uncharacterized integral membrane protein
MSKQYPIYLFARLLLFILTNRRIVKFFFFQYLIVHTAPSPPHTKTSHSVYPFSTPQSASSNRVATQLRQDSTNNKSTWTWISTSSILHLLSLLLLISVVHVPISGDPKFLIFSSFVVYVTSKTASAAPRPSRFLFVYNDFVKQNVIDVLFRIL